MLGFSTVFVTGASMAPTFNHGDWLLIRSLSGQRHTLKIGQVYLIQDPNREGVQLLKRLTQSRMEHGRTRYWVEGDSKDSNDSRKWGWLDKDIFIGKVLIRYRKGN